MVVRQNTNEYLYPEPSSQYDFVSLGKGEKINIGCPGNSVRTHKATYNKNVTVTATCIKNDTFIVDDEDISIYYIACTDHPESVGRYHNPNNHKRCANGKGVEAMVGFDLNPTFIPLITFCYDQIQQNTLYSNFTMSASVGPHYEQKVPRPRFFTADDFYSVGNNEVYRLYSQYPSQRTINELLDLPINSDFYVKFTNNCKRYLSRGHLAPKGHFVHAFQQRATYHYINVAPQWQSFNGGNWNEMEIALKSYINSIRKDLIIYTGTYGISTLPNNRNYGETELFLYTDGGRRGIPVPEQFWKIVYEPVSKKGVVLIGANNPYKTENQLNKLCSYDVNRNITWIDWNISNQEDGFIYSCSVDDFCHRVPYLPYFDVTGGLLT